MNGDIAMLILHVFDFKKPKIPYKTKNFLFPWVDADEGKRRKIRVRKLGFISMATTNS